MHLPISMDDNLFGVFHLLTTPNRYTHTKKRKTTNKNQYQNNDLIAVVAKVWKLLCVIHESKPLYCHAYGFIVNDGSFLTLEMDTMFKQTLSLAFFFLDFSTWMHQLFMHVIQWLWYQTTKAIYRDKKVKYHLRCFFPRCNSFKKVSVEIFPFKQRRFYSIEGPRTPNIFHFYWINCPFFRVKKNIIYIIYIKKKSAPQMFFNWHHFYQNYENGKPY